jgi:hypothetical protein
VVCILVQVKQQGPLALFLFNLALHYKQLWMRLGFSTTAASPLCNRLFFSKTQAGRAGARLLECRRSAVCESVVPMLVVQIQACELYIEHLSQCCTLPASS